MSVRTPSYRLHKPSGQAVVTLDGRDFYLGKHGTAESRAEYDRLVAEWLSNGRKVATITGSTVSELMVDYIRHVDSYYVKDGRPTSEAGLIRDALRVLRRLYGHTPARDFGPLALKCVRLAYIDAGLCRNEVNRRTGLVVRFFKWAVENELVPPSVHQGLKAVPGLRRGRTDVRESEPVKPVPEAFVDAVEPYVARPIWAMIHIQLLTGMRPGEVTIMRTCDLDTSGRVWVYTPESHKTEHHGRERRIYLGPRAREIIKPWLKTELVAYLFSPAQSMEAIQAERKRNRKTPMTPSGRARRRRRRPKKAPGSRYTANSYRQAVAKGCMRAGVPKWHPSQLRHTAATKLRREFGIDAARTILGHTTPTTTAIYAEADFEKARQVMERIG